MTAAAHIPPLPPGRKTVRRNPSGRPTLAEPLKIAEFWKARNGNSVRVILCTYEGHNIVDVRVYFVAADGKMQPTRKGLALSVRRLPELADAIGKAVVKARELGLIDGDGGEG
jgi:hypothetical protein